MSFGRQFLHAAVFATVWIVLAQLVTASVTHNGANRIFGLTRTQLFVVSTVIGGFLWAFVYYGALGIGRNKNTPSKHGL
jgi:uncharacterized RDD family membrane protein YckC